MIKIQLRHRFNWSQDDATAVCGSAFDRHTLMQGAALRQALKVNSELEFREKVTRLNGFFSAVHETPDALFASVDRVRSMPLFYAFKNNVFYISDSAQWLVAQLGESTPDSLRLAEIQLTGYVTGANTLYQEVKQLQAGEMLMLKKSAAGPELSLNTYHHFRRKPVLRGFNELVEGLHEVTQNAFRRLIEWANDRTLLIPLSGGYDSRLIVVMLKRLGYSNILTFSYGVPNNTEAKVSRALAEQLELPWTFVPYSNEAWRDWFHSQERLDYYEYAQRHASLPVLQDWPAIWELKQKYKRDFAVIPGHVGGFLADSRLPSKRSRVTLHEIIDDIVKRHYSLWPHHDFRDAVPDLKEQLAAHVALASINSTETAAEALEAWNWRERQAKFIINSVRAYEFWGYDWWMPLGDLEMLEFWQGIGLAQRKDKKLHAHYIDKVYQELASVPVALSQPPKSQLSLINMLKGSLPQGMLKRIRDRQRCTLYDTHPLAWYGWLAKDVFNEYCQEHENINSFLVKEMLGKLAEV